LPAFDPEIIYKYPEKDSKDLEINNLLASISFPNYIKVCYSIEEEKVYTVKNFRTCITNQLGDRFFAMFYHFYVRMGNSDFFKEYNNNLMEKIAMKYSKELNDEVESKTELINEINKRKYVYIPHCICLISKNPYFSQMEKCLESIMLTLKNKTIKEKELNEIITYCVGSIPSPYINTSISFIMPNCSDIIELSPCFYQEINILGINTASLVETLTINNIIVLLRLLLFEQKILFVSDDIDNLTKVSLNLISLLYPLNWIHIYIPIVSEKMLKYLQSFLPFFSGMHRSLFAQKKVQELLVTSHNDLYIFDIDNNTLNISCNLLKKKKVNPTKFLNKNVPNFPKKINDMIISQLNILKSYYKNPPPDVDNTISNNIKIKLLFIQVFIELLYNYKKYLVTIGDLPVFNSNDFVKEKPNNEQTFYKEFTSTQLYQLFIQNSMKYINDKNSKFYFDELIEDYLDKKEKAVKNKICIVVNNDFINSMNEKLFRINTNYIIKPSTLKIFKQIAKEFKLSKGKKLFEDLKSYSKREFKDRQDLNNNNIIKENKRIINCTINISNKNDKKEYLYFITPEEEAEKEKEKLNNERKNNFDEDNKKYKKKKLRRAKSEYIDDKDKEEGLTALEKEDIRDNIKGTLKKVFKSEKINIKEDSEILLSSLEKQYGRDYFVNLIGQNKNSKEIKIINGDSFKILLDVISKSLIKLKNMNKKIKNYAIKLLKSCCYFKTKADKKEHSLFVKIGEKLTNNYPLFNEILFWELWIEEDLNENEIQILNAFKKANIQKVYRFMDEENYDVIDFKINYKVYLKEVIRKMEEIKINRSFILSVIDELYKKYIRNDENYQKELVAEIMKMK
jgi:hypothetical protein